MSDAVLARLTPSLPRRVLGLGLLVTLGAALAFLTLDDDGTGPLATGVILAISLALVLLAAWGWQATAQSIDLTDTDLRLSDGTVLCRLSDIARIDRGAFSFKPSGGFTLHLSTNDGPARWAPGLYWQAGPRIGVGGLVSPAAARAMADLIAERIMPGA